MRHTSRPIVARGGFTLAEMLIVVGILILLMGVLLPSLGRAQKVAARNRIALMFQTITVALDTYRKDHGDYPRLYPNGANTAEPHLTGAQVLCRALIAPGPASEDGHDGPGFRKSKAMTDPDTGALVQQGKPYGPYLEADKFKISDAGEILDPNENPILYYPANKAAPISPPAGAATPPSTGGFIAEGVYGPGAGSKPRFNWNDNKQAIQNAEGKKMSLEGFRRLMGDANANGWIDGNESAAYAGDFILWSAGPDDDFGPADQTTSVGAENPCDDVSNYGRNEY